MIPVFRPSLDWAAVAEQLEPVVRSGWLGMGPKVEEFERACAKAVYAKHFIATSSCTAALHLAVHCLDLPAGARVLTTPITFVSTNAALLWCGLTPVFGWTKDGQLSDTDAAFDTVATMAVHLGGARADRAPVSHIASGNKWDYPWDKLGQNGKRSVPVIEDCAHAFGAPWLADGQDCLMRCWSFHAVKNLPMGDGGGISTNDDRLAERLRSLRWLGISKSTHERSQGGYRTDYEIPELGWKYHMNDIQAAIGLAALPQVEAHNARRREVAKRYRLEFGGPFDPDDSACHFYPLFFADREAVETRLDAAGIGYSRHYKPNFLYPPFRGFPCPGYLSAMHYYDCALVLPIFPSMTDAEVDQVIKAVRG